MARNVVKVFDVAHWSGIRTVAGAMVYTMN
jgi:hypothetical protein